MLCNFVFETRDVITTKILQNFTSLLCPSKILISFVVFKFLLFDLVIFFCCISICKSQPLLHSSHYHNLNSFNIIFIWEVGKTVQIRVHFLLAFTFSFQFFLFKYSFFIYLNFVFLTFSKHKYTSVHFLVESQISLYMLTNELHSAFI